MRFYIRFILHKIGITFILLYQYSIAPLLGDCCRFYPSCSEYAKHAITRFGFMRGVYLSLIRLSKCHPWGKGGYDPVPKHI